MPDTSENNDAVIHINMLGDFSIEYNGAILQDSVNRSQKLWSVLSYLFIHRERDIPKSEFIDVFWSDESSTNPDGALKTLFSRIRTLLESVFGPNHNLILSQRGSYSWNRAIPYRADITLFEECCIKAQNTALPGDERIQLYRNALSLYKGGFLPKLSSEFWVIPIHTHYHEMYLSAVKDFSDLLDEAGEYEEIFDTCSKAATIDPYDEGIHIRLINSLMRRGKIKASIDHYEQATKLLYQNLGIHPSKNFQALYAAIMEEEHDLQTDLEVIQGELRESAARSGAFNCSYGLFREIYRLEARRSARNNIPIHIALITVSFCDASRHSSRILNEVMEKLSKIISANLRQGDVVSRYSRAQYVLMLPSANYEDSCKITERIISSFYRQNNIPVIKLSGKARAMELE